VCQKLDADFFHALLYVPVRFCYWCCESIHVVQVPLKCDCSSVLVLDTSECHGCKVFEYICVFVGIPRILLTCIHCIYLMVIIVVMYEITLLMYNINKTSTIY